MAGSAIAVARYSEMALPADEIRAQARQTARCPEAPLARRDRKCVRKIHSHKAALSLHRTETSAASMLPNTTRRGPTPV